MKKFIGLTGPSGAGKGEVSKILSKMGFYHFDCDKIYHDLLIPPSPCLDELRLSFGDSIFFENGELNRKALAEIVFSDNGQKTKLPILNSITHKYVLEEVQRQAEELKEYRAFTVDAPTLFESGFDGQCDVVIAVLAEKETRIERIIAREGLSREAAEARINAQPDDSFYSERSDYVIYNNGSLEALEKELKRIAEEAEL